MIKYLDWMKSVKRSEYTIRNRRGSLIRFTRWAGGPILYLAADQLRDWQVATAPRLAAGSLRTEITSLVDFYRWAVREGLLDGSPAEALMKPRSPRRLPRPARDRDLKYALFTASPPTAAIISLSCMMGLRAGEIAGLKWVDVDLEGRQLRVLGKGDIERVLHIPETVAGYLSRIPGPRPKHGPVISRIDGKPGPNRPARISEIAGRHFRRVGVGIRLHQGRHRFATMALERTGDLRGVQEAMGHLSIRTTALYTKVSGGRVRAVLDAAGELD